MKSKIVFVAAILSKLSQSQDYDDAEQLSKWHNKKVKRIGEEEELVFDEEDEYIEEAEEDEPYADEYEDEVLSIQPELVKDQEMR